MKLDFEIAVDQQTRAHDLTFEGVPGARGTAKPLFGQFCSNSEKCPANFRIWRQIFFKGLIQNSIPKLKVEIQFYVDSENFMKNIEILLSSIIFNEVNCLEIAN